MRIFCKRFYCTSSHSSHASKQYLPQADTQTPILSYAGLHRSSIPQRCFHRPRHHAHAQQRVSARSARAIWPRHAHAASVVSPSVPSRPLATCNASARRLSSARAYSSGGGSAGCVTRPRSRMHTHLRSARRQASKMSRPDRPDGKHARGARVEGWGREVGVSCAGRNCFGARI
eukprot:6186647-Pleurochrysis_carterae.AAC.3